MATEVVLVDFQVDYSQIDNAVDTLEKTGEVDAALAQQFRKTTEEIKKQAAEIKRLQAVEKENAKTIREMQAAFKASNSVVDKNIVSLDELSAAMKDFLDGAVEGIKEGFLSELEAAGVSLEEFVNAVTTGGAEVVNSQESLKKKLREVQVELQQLQIEGEQNSDRYRELIRLAGEYGDAIDEVNNQIKNARDGEKTINSLVGAATALVSVFSASQAAFALLGDESEEYEKALLKVNAAMAILQALQAVTVGLQSDGIITQAILNTQQKIRNAQLSIEVALESKNVVVKGLATAAQWALNAAMNANPIGIIITALAAAIPLLLAFANNTRRAAEEQAKLDAAIARSTKLLEAEIDGLEASRKKFISDLNEAGAVQSRITKEEIANIKLAQDARRRAITDAAAELLRTQDAVDEKTIEKRKELQDSIDKITADGVSAALELYQKEGELRRQVIEESLKSQIGATAAGLAAVEEGTRAQLNLQKQLVIQERELALNAAGLTAGETIRIRAEANKRLIELEAAFQGRLASIRLSALNNQLINVEKNTREEFNLRSRIIAEQANVELANIALSEAEKKNIRERAFQEQIALQREFDRRLTEEAIAEQIARNSAELAKRNILEEDKLNLTISNIELAAAAEIVAAEGNSAKIKEINARRDKDIREARKASILAISQYEQQLEDAVGGVRRRALERQASDARSSLFQRRQAILELANIQLNAVDREISDTQRLYEEKLISQEEYNLKYAQLEDKRAEITENANIKIKEETVKAYQQIVNETLGAFQLISQGVSNLAAENQQNSQITIDNKRKETEELLKSGAITEREAIDRAKAIDREESALKRKAAEQAKDLAIFNAVISTLQGVAAAIARVELFPFNFVLAGIVGALGLAQVSAISSRPIPRFFKGKKKGDNYEGPGYVGDMGPELAVDAEGNLTYYRKPTLTYVGKDDRIYTAAETNRILAGNAPTPEGFHKEVSINKPDFEIDYDKLGQAVAKYQKVGEGSSITIDREFISESVKGSLSSVSYLDRYYRSK